MEYLVNDTDLEAVADAIREKGGTSESLEFPGDFVTAIEDIPTGGGNIYDDVVFWDSLANDGNGGVVYSYSASDFLALTAMPANPDHSDFETHGIEIPMTSQGWNWSLADAKTYVQSYGKLHIGQMYIPTDGKSHYICYAQEDGPEDAWNTEIDLSVSGGYVEWQVGDSLVNTSSGNIDVTFPSHGWHDVKINAQSGVTYSPYYSSSTKETGLIGKIQKIIQVFIGDDVTSIGDYAFKNCYSLTTVTIPHGVTGINTYAFEVCSSLTSVTIPSGVTSLGSYAFDCCLSAAFVTLPRGITSIGSNVLRGCHNLTSVTIPGDETSISNYAFQNCRSLKSITIPNGTTTIGYYAFNNCDCLQSVTIPESVIEIDNCTFEGCYSLKSVTIQEGIQGIGNYAFHQCFSLLSITIPDGLQGIGNSAFDSCYSLKEIIMESATPPYLVNSNAFNNLMSDYTIIVPAGSLSAYTSANNWSTVSSHIVEAT